MDETDRLYLKRRLENAKDAYLAALMAAATDAQNVARATTHDAYVEAKTAFTAAEGILPI
jgi:hypothetical protein